MTLDRNTSFEKYMKRLPLLLMLLSVCSLQEAFGQRDWQKRFGLTHNPDVDSIWHKPVSYYLEDKDCSVLAKQFYYGQLRPQDDPTTDTLLSLAASGNDKLRPFYRWCLNKTIIIQDGALGEHTGIPARKYAEKFPKEFFEYMDIDSTGRKYKEWVGCIRYSGFYDYNAALKSNDQLAKLANIMKANCKDCDARLLARIDKFAKECFSISGKVK